MGSVRNAPQRTQQRHVLRPSRKASPKWILEGDIQGCFDNISHDWMIENISMDKVILRKWLKAGFMDKGALFPTEAGAPQGGLSLPNVGKHGAGWSGTTIAQRNSA